MDEREWLACTDPDLMLRYLHGLVASRRKLRLFACSCFPAIRHLWSDTRIGRGLEQLTGKVPSWASLVRRKGLALW